MSDQPHGSDPPRDETSVESDRVVAGETNGTGNTGGAGGTAGMDTDEDGDGDSDRGGDGGARESQVNGHGTGSEGAGEALELRREPLVDGDEPTVLLFLPANRNRRLLAEFLDDRATVVATTDVGAFGDAVDLCIVDRERLVRNREALAARQAAAAPVFLPVVLLAPESQRIDPETWSAVDEVLRTPVSKATLRARLQNLLIRRRRSDELAQRETELDTALAELRVRDRAMSEAPIGVTITGTREEDCPLVYVNDAFLRLTGYDRGEVIGRNCRFLQGPQTDDATVREVRAAIDAAEPVSVDLVNYTRNGERFWNKVDIAPVRDDAGEVTHFVGFQTAITTRKLHEQRVNVLNRFMRHNLRNELNIIDGYRNALVAEDTSIDRETALAKLGAAVDRLVGLSEEVSHVERVFNSRPADNRLQPVSAVLSEIRDEVSARHTGVAVTVEPPDEPAYVSAESLSLGCADYLSMLLDGNERADPEVSVVATREASVVDIAFTDNGDGLAASAWAVIEAGVETPLEHTDRLGLWVLQWAAAMNGGELLRTDEDGGTLHVRCPLREPPSTVAHDSSP